MGPKDTIIAVRRAGDKLRLNNMASAHAEQDFGLDPQAGSCGIQCLLCSTCLVSSTACLRSCGELARIHTCEGAQLAPAPFNNGEPQTDSPAAGQASFPWRFPATLLHTTRL